MLNPKQNNGLGAVPTCLEPPESTPRTERARILVSYPDPYVRNDDHRLQYDITYRGHTVSDDHRYVHMGLGTRLRVYHVGV